MKVFTAVAAGFILCASSALAQISVQTDDGRQVTIGQNGITINGVHTGRRANVNLGYGGIQIDSDNGLRRAKVNIGTSQNVQIKKTTAKKTVSTRLHKPITQTAQAPIAYVKESASMQTPAQVSYQAPSGSYQVAELEGPQLTDMVINENNQVIKGNCNGNAIIVNGNNCELQLSGKLGLVTINGNRNRVQSEQIGLVIANGNSNNVTWSHPQGAPLVTNNGRDNLMHGQ